MRVPTWPTSEHVACFASTKVQELTQKALLGRALAPLSVAPLAEAEKAHAAAVAAPEKALSEAQIIRRLETFQLHLHAHQCVLYLLCLHKRQVRTLLALLGAQRGAHHPTA